MDRAPEHQIFESLYNQIEPVKIIMDGKSQNTLISAVKKIVYNDSNEGTCKLLFVSAKEYSKYWLYFYIGFYYFDDIKERLNIHTRLSLKHNRS